MQPRIDNPVFESARVVGHWAKAQVLISIITAVLYSAGFAVAHVPLWLLVGLLNGFCHMIPRVGGLIGLAIAAAAALFGGLDLTHWAILLATWVIVQGIEGFILTPRIMGTRLGLSPFIVFLVLLAGGFFLGPIGLIVAVPLAAIINVFWRFFRQPRPANIGRSA